MQKLFKLNNNVIVRFIDSVKDFLKRGNAVIYTGEKKVGLCVEIFIKRADADLSFFCNGVDVCVFKTLGCKLVDRNVKNGLALFFGNVFKCCLVVNLFSF